MKKINELMTNNLGQTESSTKPSTGIFDDEQRKRINHFFALIRVGWGVAKFNSQFGDEEDIKHTKRFFAQQILQYTPEKLGEAVEMAVNLRGQGDENFLFPDVAKIMGLIGSDWEGKRMHREYTGPELPYIAEGTVMLEGPTKEQTAAEAMAEMREIMGIGAN